MSSYSYTMNGEEVRCVNCGNMDLPPQNSEQMHHFMVYECTHCHFVSWFPDEFASESGKAKWKMLKA